MSPPPKALKVDFICEPMSLSTYAAPKPQCCRSLRFETPCLLQPFLHSSHFSGGPWASSHVSYIKLVTLDDRPVRTDDRTTGKGPLPGFPKAICWSSLSIVSGQVHGRIEQYDYEIALRIRPHGAVWTPVIRR